LKDFGPDCDSDCQKKGSEWSTAFFANAVIIMLVIFNMVCACVGTKKAIARVIASCCACAICCAHFGIIITTAVFRFRPQGQLCALSLRPTSVPADKDSEITDDWTYEKDGALLLALWIIQLLCCCCCGGAGSGHGNKPQANMGGSM